MKLYSAKAAGDYAFAVVAANAKEGTDPDFITVKAGGIEQALNQIQAKGQRNAGPHVLGRYDEQGYYCTYCPAVEGIKPGRFVRHPLAEQAKRDYDNEVQNKDYGPGTPNF